MTANEDIAVAASDEDDVAESCVFLLYANAHGFKQRITRTEAEQLLEFAHAKPGARVTGDLRSGFRFTGQSCGEPIVMYVRRAPFTDEQEATRTRPQPLDIDGIFGRRLIEGLKEIPTTGRVLRFGHEEQVAPKAWSAWEKPAKTNAIASPTEGEAA